MFSAARNRPAGRRPNLADAVLAAVLAAASLAPWYLGRLTGGGAPVRVEAVSGAARVLDVPLTGDGEYRVAGALGDSRFQVSGGRVRMTGSPCRNKYCVRQGWKSRPGDMIVCAPNRVGLFLRGGSAAPDAVSR
jgi:hypothetical protein